ncbi:MAG: hypothetical protein IPI49_22205 [Myxococcales bacterium]|nr:hypothetical protein [Myxococcales bacterium]
MIKITLQRSFVAGRASRALQAMIVMAATAATAASGCGPRVSPAQVPAEPPPQVAPDSPAPPAASARASAKVPTSPRGVDAADREPAGPEEGGVAGPDATEAPAAQGEPASARAPALVALAAALTEAKVSVLEMSPLEHECANLPARATLISMNLPGSAQDCAVGQGRSVCVPAVRRPDKLRQTLCGAGMSAKPAGWPPALERALDPLVRMGWRVRPMDGRGAPPALAAYDPMGAVSLLVSDGVSWQVMSEALPSTEEQGPHAGPRAVMRAAGLGHGAKYAVVIDEYEGGSESGWQTTWLFILCGEGLELTVCTRKAIGALVWSLGPGERAAYRRGGASLTRRPHLAVSLAPSLAANATTLRLKLTRRTLPAKLRDRFQLTPPECEPSGDPLEPGSCDPWSAMDALRADAGDWRFDGQALVRAGSER